MSFERLSSARIDTHRLAFKLLKEQYRQQHQDDASVGQSDTCLNLYRNRSKSDGAFFRCALRQLPVISGHSDLRRRKSLGVFDIHPAKSIDQSNSDRRRIDPAYLVPPVLFVASDPGTPLVSFNRTMERQPPLRVEHRFVPYFSLAPDATQLVHQRKICLESVQSEGTRMTMTVLAADSPEYSGKSFTKRLFARWTLDGWRTHFDSQAVVRDRLQSAIRYSLDIDFYGKVGAGSRLELALAYEISRVGGQQVASFWDNNATANYAFWYSD